MGNTGFIEACCHNNICAIKLLMRLYSNIVEQKNNTGKTGYDYLT